MKAVKFLTQMKVVKFLVGLFCLLFVMFVFPASFSICFVIAAWLVYNGFHAEGKETRLAYYAGAILAMSFANGYTDIIIKALVMGGIIYMAKNSADR